MEYVKKEIRCGKCGRLLAVGTALGMTIKCKCGTYNHIQVVTMRAVSPNSEKSELNHASASKVSALGG